MEPSRIVHDAGERPRGVRGWFAAVCGVDEWLICLLFRSMFIPLGGVWSADAARRRTAPPGPVDVRSVATAALLVQVAVVYLVAGLARRWNARQSTARQIRSLEMRLVRQRVTPDDDLRYETLLVAWPDRSANGSGNLARFLRLAEAGD